jgi:hypothetical protein
LSAVRSPQDRLAGSNSNKVFSDSSNHLCNRPKRLTAGRANGAMKDGSLHWKSRPVVMRLASHMNGEGS